MILFSVLIFSTKFLDSLILNLTYIFLEGSSEGKSVLLFGIMGSILLLYPLFNNNGKIMQKISSLNPAFKGNGNMYLKLAIIIVAFNLPNWNFNRDYIPAETGCFHIDNLRCDGSKPCKH